MALIKVELSGIAGQTFQLKGLTQRIGYLPNTIQDKMIPPLMDNLSEILVKKMKLRAPIWSRKLWKGIRAQYVGKNTIRVFIEGPAAGYAAAQESDYRRHAVGGWQPTKSGYAFADWLLSKGTPGAQWSTFFPQKFTPFAQPAFESLLKNIDEISKAEVENGLRKAGF